MLLWKPHLVKFWKSIYGAGEQGVTSFGHYLAKEELGAALQELGWQGSWYLAHGCGPPVRLHAMVSITFPSRLQSSQQNNGFYFCKQLHLGNGTVWVQETIRILCCGTPLLRVSCLLAEWMGEEWHKVRELLGCGDNGCLWCFPAVHRHCSQHLEKAVPGRVPPLASALVCSCLETVLVWNKCKLTSKILSLLSKDIVLKGK